MVIVFIQQLIEKFLIGCRTYIFANDIYIYNLQSVGFLYYSLLKIRLPVP